MGKWYYSFMPLGLIESVNENIQDYKTNLSFLTSVDPELLESLSEKKVLRIFKNAKKNIPAYKKVLKENKIGSIRTITDFNTKLPVLDKHNYVHKYSLLERTNKKELPKMGGLLVESSGSTSKTPTNWFRTLDEEKAIQKDVTFESKYIFGDKEYIILSCWSLGAWTTSYSFCYYFEPLGIVKNIGPDVAQIVQTIKMMGNKHNYLLGGYPPFIKHLLDTGKLDWKKYNINLVVGGEGFIPGWRTYVKSKLKRGSTIISAYGASDLETGMAVETPLCQNIRELFRKNPKKVKKVFGVDKLPLFFQYNPLRFYIGNIEKTKEFHTTVLTKGHVGCKVKYNIKDVGGKKTYNEMIGLLFKHFKEFEKTYENVHKTHSLKLPFLWVSGRSDAAVTLAGVNMHPQQVELALLANKNVYGKIQSFQISSVHHTEGDYHFLIAIQLQENILATKEFAKKVTQTIKKNLSKINKAYKIGLHDLPTCYEPHVKLYKYNTGPFKTGKIKQKYIKA